MSALEEFKRPPMILPAELVSSTAKPVDLLLRYQKELLQTTAVHQVTVVEKSRRTGYTWGVAADACLTSAAEKAAGGMDTFYIGYNLDMAREFIDTCAGWAKLFGRACSEVQEFLYDNDGTAVQAFRINFASGFEIVALPSRPRSLRGRQGYVIIDEAAFHDDLAEMIKAAIALLMWGGKVLIISTHDGDTNPFAELVNDIRSGRKPYKLLRCTLDDAIEDGLYKRICMVRNQAWSEEGQATWREQLVKQYGDAADEELFCIARSGSGTFLPGALIEARMDATIPVIRWSQPDSFVHLAEHLRQAECREWCERELKPLLSNLDRSLRTYFGQDFGRKGDLSVMWPTQLTQEMRRRAPFVAELRNIPFQQQEQILFYIIDRLPRFGGGKLDAGGNGAALAEAAVQRYGALIEEVKFSAEWYRENMPKFKAAFEDDVAVVPKDADIYNDHRAIKMERGIAKIPDKRQDGADGGKRHGDSAIAHVLSFCASLDDKGEIEFRSTGAARESAQGFGHSGHIAGFGVGGGGIAEDFGGMRDLGGFRI